MTKTPLTVDCPTCKKTVEWGEQSPYRPFCSKRCQLIDLGEWNEEQHKIPAEPEVNELESMSDEELETYILSKSGGSHSSHH